MLWRSLAQLLSRTRLVNNTDSGAGADYGSPKIAHVIVTSDNILVSKPLEKAMPSKPLNSIYLVGFSVCFEVIRWLAYTTHQADSSAASSIEFVRARLQEYGLPDVVKPDNEQEITLLGGRLSDLEVLLQKLRSGFTLESAVEDIITRARCLAGIKAEADCP